MKQYLPDWMGFAIIATVLVIVALALSSCATPEQIERNNREEARVERITSENITCIDLDMNFTICDIRMPSGVKCVALIEYDSAQLSCNWGGS